MFSKRQAKESNFYYDFEVDKKGHIISLFWRDGIIKRHSESFGDLVVHDTIFNTNKYDMICGPFVGMTHH